jgi:polynucleotide 5'-kinase involved in rRNA processing
MITPGPDWQPLLDRLEGAVVMVIGCVGAGKSTLARWLATTLAARGPTALLDTDMGQAAIAPPTCLGLALTPPWTTPAAAWFIGDTSPTGNLLPAVVGAAKLAAHARCLGARTVILDTTGLVEGPVARLLKLHKALATGVTHVVAVQREGELEPMLALLEGPAGQLHRVAAAPEARDRTPAERRHYREARLRAHLDRARLVQLDAAPLVRPDWTLSAPGAATNLAPIPPGTLVGLLDRAGFCLALGVIVQHDDHHLDVYTPVADPSSIARIQPGRFRLGAGCEELR